MGTGWAGWRGGWGRGWGELWPLPTPTDAPRQSLHGSGARRSAATHRLADFTKFSFSLMNCKSIRVCARWKAESMRYTILTLILVSTLKVAKYRTVSRKVEKRILTYFELKKKSSTPKFHLSRPMASIPKVRYLLVRPSIKLSKNVSQPPQIGLACV